MIGASRTIARAIAMRWRWPPESLPPPASSSVSYPSGRLVMKSCAMAFFAASSTSASVALGRPKRMFSRTVARKMTVSWLTRATLLRSDASRTLLMSWSSMKIPPACTS